MTMELFPFILGAACLFAACAAWTDVRKAEIPAFLPWTVFAMGAATWAQKWTLGDLPPLPEAAISYAIIGALIVQGSLGPVYAKALFAFVTLFSAFGKAPIFLETTLFPLLLVVLVQASVFYARLFLKESGRRTLAKHWNEGFSRRNGAE